MDDKKFQPNWRDVLFGTARENIESEERAIIPPSVPWQKLTPSEIAYGQMVVDIAVEAIYGPTK